MIAFLIRLASPGQQTKSLYFVIILYNFYVYADPTIFALIT